MSPVYTRHGALRRQIIGEVWSAGFPHFKMSHYLKNGHDPEISYLGNSEK